jgi:hypothetical protein
MCGSVLSNGKLNPFPVPVGEVRHARPETTVAERPIPTDRAAALDRVAPVASPEPDWHQPTLESLREAPFSRVEFSFEGEERAPAWKRIFGALFILALLAGTGYVGYLLGWWGSGVSSITQKSNPPAASTPAGETTDNKTAEPAATAPDGNGAAATPSPNSGANSPATASEEKKPEASPEKTTPEKAAGTGETAAASPKHPAATSTEKAEPRAVAEAKKPATTPTPTIPKKSAAISPSDAGASTTESDAAFKKGEAYLYGRGVPENCDQANKYLKAAADQSSKARAAFGTMYATGHCAPRDLPTSYRWFAQALRLDPNNQILEKDLSAIWNQMTPPERQLATKMSGQGQ